MSHDDSTSSSWDSLSVGDAGPTLVVDGIEREDFVRFAGATGDFNPMHYDEPAAEAAGHGGVFGPGMFVGGLCSRMLVDWFGLENVRRFSVRFTDRVWPDDSITVTGEVTDKSVDGEDRTVDVSFEAANQDGVVVVTGNATASIPDGA